MFSPRLKNPSLDEFFWSQLLQASEAAGGCRSFDMRTIRALWSNSFKKEIMDGYMVKLEADGRVRLDRRAARIILNVKVTKEDKT
jgi:hypothetical protein